MRLFRFVIGIYCLVWLLAVGAIFVPRLFNG